MSSAAPPQSPVGDAVVEGAGWETALLQRLERLCALESAHQASLNDEGRHLIRHAIFATFVECRDSGIGPAAAKLLEEEPVR